MSDLRFDIDIPVIVDDGIDITELGSVLQHFTNDYLYVTDNKLHGVSRNNLHNLGSNFDSVECRGNVFVVSGDFNLIGEYVCTTVYCFKKDMVEYLMLDSYSEEVIDKELIDEFYHEITDDNEIADAKEDIAASMVAEYFMTRDSENTNENTVNMDRTFEDFMNDTSTPDQPCSAEHDEKTLKLIEKFENPVKYMDSSQDSMEENNGEHEEMNRMINNFFRMNGDCSDGGSDGGSSGCEYVNEGDYEGESVSKKRKIFEEYDDQCVEVCEVMASALINKMNRTKQKEEKLSEYTKLLEEESDPSDDVVIEIFKTPNVTREKSDNVKLSSLDGNLKDALIKCYMDMKSDSYINSMYYNAHLFFMIKEESLYSVYDYDDYTNVPCLKEGLQGESSIAQFYVLKSPPIECDLASEILNEYTDDDFPSDDFSMIFRDDSDSDNIVVEMLCSLGSEPYEWKNKRINNAFVPFNYNIT